MTIEQIVAALVIALRVQSVRERPPVMPARVVNNIVIIVEAAVAADPRPEFVRLALAVCVAESGLQLRQRDASLCGCQPYNTDGTTQARCVARSLAAGLTRCGTVERAINRYVTGRCSAPRRPTRGAVEWRSLLVRYRAIVRALSRAMSPGSD